MARMAAVTPAGQAAEGTESVSPRQTDRQPAPPESPARDETASSLLLGSESRLWRRQLGALAWVALEELALASHRDHQGWAAPVGVRDIASAIGTTQDTAARAVAALGAAGLVTLDRVTDLDGRRRSGYRLRFPDGIALHDSPSIHDDPGPGSPVRRPKDGDAGSPEAANLCPEIKDSQACPVNPDSRDRQPQEERSTKPPRSGTRRASGSQPRLFDSPIGSGEAVR
jgi:hypothetical protein